MPYLIPNDWDGSTWQNYQVQWPASDQYLSILAGLLSSTSHTWSWDRISGDQQDAADIGQEIVERNSTTGLLPAVETPMIQQLAWASNAANASPLNGFAPVAGVEYDLCQGATMGPVNGDCFFQGYAGITARSPSNTYLTFYVRNATNNDHVATGFIRVTQNTNLQKNFVCVGIKKNYSPNNNIFVPKLTLIANNNDSYVYFRASEISRVFFAVQCDPGGSNLEVETV